MITGSSSKTLPDNPSAGQIVFVKGTSGRITINAGGKMIMHEDDATQTTTYDCGQKSMMFIYSGQYWIAFYCG